jgi:DNA-binding winged helix-turn-helix (wHTH) protein/TolB-like protein/Tfp pilus assembly protein PilF
MRDLQVLRVGDWELDPALNELRQGEQTVKLEPKAIELLAFLAKRAGQVVSREELLAAVWPGVVVTDDTVTQAVLKLRRSLGDDARSPRYIETISKRGYRLIAPADERVPALPWRRKRWALGSVAILVVAAATTLFLVDRRTDDPADDKPLSRLPTITVLPFESVEDEDTQRRLGRGLAADLGTDLAKLGGLRIISPGRLPGWSVDLAQLRQRGVRYVVSGTVQRANEQLKINARLIDTRDGALVWSERYERPLADLFDVQDELTRKLVSALPVKVTEAEYQALARRYTRNLAAYDGFLQAQAALMTRQPADNARARELYQKAIAHDPTFARAYAGMALTYAADFRNQWTPDGARALGRAMEMAETALRMDSRLPEAHWVLGYVHMLRGEHAKGIERAKSAIAIDASYADAHALVAGILTYTSEPAAALPWIRKALRLNPDGGYLYYVVLGRAYLFSGDAEQALINLHEALGRNAADVETQAYIAAALLMAGKQDDAKWQAEEIRAAKPQFSARTWFATHPIAEARQRERLISMLEALGL